MIAASRKMPLLDPSSEVRLHLALYHTRRLGQDLFFFHNQAECTLLPGLSSGLDACRSQCETLLELGMVGEAEHLAHEALEWDGDSDTSFEPGERFLFYADPRVSRWTATDVYFLWLDATSGLRMSSRSAAPASLPPGIDSAAQYALAVDRTSQFLAERACIGFQRVLVVAENSDIDRLN